MSDQNLMDYAQKFPEPFNIYGYILKNHLHFGYWPRNSGNVSLETAQDYLYELLAGYLPKPPLKILDAGCGLGRSSKAMAEQGHKVTAIAPDPEMIECASKISMHEGLNYVVSDFLQYAECETGQGGFDVIFMQESLQYMRPLHEVFKSSWKILSPRGRIILCDETRVDKNTDLETAVHKLRDIIKTAYENGFYIKHKLMIGKQVKNTCDEILARITEKRSQIIEVLGDEAVSVLNNLERGWRQQKGWYENCQFEYVVLVLIKDNVSVMEYEPGDEIITVPLFNKVFNVERTMEHWQWKYVQNPYSKTLMAKAVMDNGDIGAQLSGYALSFFDSATPRHFLAVHAGDVMTAPLYRGVGMGPTSLLSRVTDYFSHALCAERFPFFYGFNAGKMRKMGEKFLEFQYLTRIPFFVLEKKDFPKNTISGFLKRFYSYKVEEASSLEREWDDFFEEACRDYGLLVCRTREYLQWRYMDCPDAQHHVLVVRRRGKIVGWGVFSRKANALVWGDALFLRAHASAAEDLLAHAVFRVFPGVEVVEGWFSPVPEWWYQNMFSMGFRVVPQPDGLAPCFRFFDGMYGIEHLEARFYYTMGDSDLF